MNQQHPQIAPYARIAVKLLQGAVSDDQEDLWQELVQYGCAGLPLHMK
jgi:hypothetical protein